MTPELTSLLQAAAAASQAGRSGVARERWEQALRVAPDQPIALNGLGMLALAGDRADEALGYFGRAAASDPGALVLWLNHARAARTLGDNGTERQSLLRALAIDPSSLLVNVRLGDNAERRGDDQEAVARRQTVVRLAEGMSQIPADALDDVEKARRYVASQVEALEQRIHAVLAACSGRSTPADRRRINAAIDHMFGRRTFYLNQCSGLHVPFLPAEEFFDRALFPWFADLDAATETIRTELAPVLGSGSQGFEPYVQLPAGTPRNVWTQLDGSADWNTLHLWRHGRRNEAACARFPRTAALIEALPLARLPDRMPTVFFSVLAPHAHIPAHTGVTNARAIVHLPLVVPPGCRFRVGGETRAWIEGTAFAFDDTIEHEAWNDSDLPRVVLILDTWNPFLTEVERDLLIRFYRAEGVPEAAD